MVGIKIFLFVQSLWVEEFLVDTVNNITRGVYCTITYEGVLDIYSSCMRMYMYVIIMNTLCWYTFFIYENGLVRRLFGLVHLIIYLEVYILNINLLVCLVNKSPRS